MNAARRSALSLVAHAVDDEGALCGARPSGRWRLSTRLPVNCARCLIEMRRPRLAACETPMSAGAGQIHLRLVGPEGVSLYGNSAGARTLCGLIVGWDLGRAAPTDVEAGAGRCSDCGREARRLDRPAFSLPVAPSNAPPRSAQR